jgi:hypothetical protein
LHGPFVVSFEDDGADKPGDRSLIGEDADGFYAVLDLAIEAFEWVVELILAQRSFGNVSRVHLSVRCHLEHPDIWTQVI